MTSQNTEELLRAEFEKEFSFVGKFLPDKWLLINNDGNYQFGLTSALYQQWMVSHSKSRITEQDLVVVITDLSDELEAEIGSKYTPETLKYPSRQKAFDADMVTVLRARALLAKLNEVK